MHTHVVVPVRPRAQTPTATPHTLLRLLPFYALAAAVLWALLTPSAMSAIAPRAPAAVSVLLVFLITFLGLSLGVGGRLTMVAFGAGLCLLLGTALGFYGVLDAARNVWVRRAPLGLLAGIGLITGLLQESGWFERLAERALVASRGSFRRLFATLCLLTFALSMFVNNLAAIFVIVPLSVRIAEALDMDPVPLVLGEVIASNLGGASTLVGDFPNMLIAAESGMGFLEFLVYLAPICILELWVLIHCLGNSFTDRALSPEELRALSERLRATPFDARAVKRGLAYFAGMLLSLPITGHLGLSPAVGALIAGHLAMVGGGVPWRSVVRHVGIRDLVFFACLFVMVGAVEASKVLEGPSADVVALWARNPVWGALAVAWGAALLTCLLNAGPTTALLIPMGAALVHAGAGHEVWWAISLGVCAGSSATITGATAGPVSAQFLEDRGHSLTFNRFAITGLPMMLLFLAVASAYLAVLLY